MSQNDSPKWAYSRVTDQLFRWPSLEEAPIEAAEEGDEWIDVRHADGEMIFDESNVRVYDPE